MKKTIFIIILILSFVFRLAPAVIASTTQISNGLNYLRTNQDSTGKITGFGGESQWAAIAFSANGINPNDVKNPETSLKTYLLSDQPAQNASATEWERRILAIVAIGENPSDFGGVNYIQNLQSLAKNQQLGDTSLLNDDIFGLLALVASGPLADKTIKQDVLNFIIAHQASDGGFSYSTDTTCAWCSSDGNDTAAALQALQAAKQSGLANAGLDNSIDKAKTFLLTTQKSNGGFGYDSFSDPDGSSTAWAVMALNSLGLDSSPQAQEAVTWLINNQEADGGFHWMAGYGSDTSTTSHAVIALSGKSWILQTYTISPTSSPSLLATPSPTPTPTVTVAPTLSPTPSPSVTPTPSPSPTSTPTPSPTPTSEPTATPASSPSPTPTVTPTARLISTARKNVSPTPKPEVLGTSIESTPLPITKVDAETKNESIKKDLILGIGSIGGVILLIIGLKIWENKKEK